MPGGHLVALSRPDELTARLEAYAIDVARRTASLNRASE
jgi:hypothetical protein